MIIGANLPVNATGWPELFDGHIVTAAFVMYDAALAGWTVAILFIVYQFMLWMKTRNMTIMWITGAMFAGMFVTAQILDATGNPILKPISIQVIFAILVFELGAILYMWFWK